MPWVQSLSFHGSFLRFAIKAIVTGFHINILHNTQYKYLDIRKIAPRHQVGGKWKEEVHTKQFDVEKYTRLIVIYVAVYRKSALILISIATFNWDPISLLLLGSDRLGQ